MLLFVSLSLLLCGVIATPIATINNNQRIVGGEDAHDGQFPYQVSIRFAFIGLHLCGGSIISNEWILTAANCVSDDIGIFRVVVGSIYPNSGGVTHKILYGVQHPEYSEEDYLINDVGLIRTKEPIIFSDLIQPIKLSSQPSSIGLPLTVAGWGWLDGNNPGISNILQYITVNTISLLNCEELFNNTIRFNDTQICTYSITGKAICEFDVGNPLVYNGEQYAITSAFATCGHGYPDVHTGVESYLSWIKEISNV